MRISPILQGIRNAYSGRYALATNTITAASLGCIGDLLAQKSEKQFSSKEWDFQRTRNMTIVCTGAAPLMHFWYRFLDRRFPGNALRVVAKKVLIDLMTGPVWYGWYLGGLCFLKGNSWPQTVQEFKDKIPIIIAVDLTLWPIFQGANFKFFQPQYRILVMKVNELVLDIVFSHVINNEYTLSSLLQSISRPFTKKSE